MLSLPCRQAESKHATATRPDPDAPKASHLLFYLSASVAARDDMSSPVGFWYTRNPKCGMTAII
jgi:hypothetical protein